MARDKETTKELKRAMISSTIRATKKISELPKNANWKTNGDYCRELMEHVITICEQHGLLPTMAHMASALGVPKDVVNDVLHRYIRANPDVVEVLTEYYSLCENVTVSSTLDGGTNNIAGIFILKSQYGYKEEPREVIMTHNKLLGERKDPAAIAQRYADAMVVDGSELKPIEDKQTEVTSEEFDF